MSTEKTSIVPFPTINLALLEEGQTRAKDQNVEVVILANRINGRYGVITGGNTTQEGDQGVSSLGNIRIDPRLLDLNNNPEMIYTPMCTDAWRDSVAGTSAIKVSIGNRINEIESTYDKKLSGGVIAVIENKTLDFMKLLREDTLLKPFIDKYANSSGFNKSWEEIVDILKKKGSLGDFLGSLVVQKQDGNLQEGFTDEYLYILNAIYKFYAAQKLS